MDKQSLRVEHRKQRIAVDVSLAICQRLATWKPFCQASALLCYDPLPQEVDIRPLWSCGKDIYLPAISGESMDFRKLDDTATAGPFGLLEAHGELFCEESKSAIILVPGLSFDRQGYRLGRGKGYYDRFLKGQKWLTVGLQEEKNLEIILPHEDHDVPLDVIFTEKGIYRL